ncbi:MAG: hypothetical protein V4509_05270 [Patescibacteria group bacterium]
MKQKLEKVIKEYLEKEGFLVRQLELKLGNCDEKQINCIGAIIIRAEKK